MSHNPTKSRWWIRPIVLAAALTVALVTWRALPLTDYVGGILEKFESMGVLGLILFGLLYIAACVLLVPSSLLTLAGGALFGVARSFVTVWLCATVGAALAFLIARYVAREPIARMLQNRPQLLALDDAIALSGWRIVFLLRLSPVFPFNMLNYAFGLTRVSFRHFALASWIGMLPGTLLYAYIGAAAGELAALAAGRRTLMPIEWGFYVFGLVMTLAVTVYVTRIARRALSEALPTLEDEPSQNSVS